MLYELAMTPDLFDRSVVNTDNAGTILVQLLRGLEENGLLANFDKGRWSRHVEQRLESLAPGLKDKVKTCLKVLDARHRLVRHPKCMVGEPETDLDWLDLALTSHARIRFHAIVLSQSLMDGCNRKCDDFVEFFGSLDSPQWNELRKRTLPLTKSYAEFRVALAPILRHAKSLALIDPWLNSQESRWFDTVSICSNLMGQRGQVRLQGRIDIHAEARRQKPESLSLADHLKSWKQKLQPLSSADRHRFRVFLWESLSYSKSLHDRFILTDQCGISAPGGLDCRTHSCPNSTDWSLLDEDVRIGRWSDYDISTSPFKFLDKVEVR